MDWTVFWLILILIAIFIALIVILRLLFYQDFNIALKRLKNLQEEALVKEANLEEELERAKKEREAEIERGKDEAQALIEKARKEAEVVREKIEDKAKQESQKSILYAKKEIDRIRKSLVSEIEGEALNLAVAMVEAIFSEKGKEALHRDLSEEVIEEIKSLEKEVFSVKVEAVELISSVPLNKEQRSRVESMLSNRMNSAVTLEEKEDKTLIAGFIVKMGQFIIDGSLKSKLNKIVPLLKGKTNFQQESI